MAILLLPRRIPRHQMNIMIKDNSWMCFNKPSGILDCLVGPLTREGGPGLSGEGSLTMTLMVSHLHSTLATSP